MSCLVRAFWSELFLGRVKKWHSAAEARTLISTANFRGCRWASRPWVIHGGCEDGVLKVGISCNRNDRFWRSRRKVCVSCKRINCFSKACQIELGPRAGTTSWRATDLGAAYPDTRRKPYREPLQTSCLGKNTTHTPRRHSSFFSGGFRRTLSEEEEEGDEDTHKHKHA